MIKLAFFLICVNLFVKLTKFLKSESKIRLNKIGKNQKLLKKKLIIFYS